jgi:hypothetical protein
MDSSHAPPTSRPYIDALLVFVSVALILFAFVVSFW